MSARTPLRQSQQSLAAVGVDWVTNKDAPETHSFGWPQAMKRRTAAAYLDLSLTDFDREVANAKLPPGVSLGRSLHWLRVSIDEHLDRLSGDVAPSWRARSPLYNPSLLPAKGRRTKRPPRMKLKRIY